MTTDDRAPLFREIEPPQGLFSAILTRIALARRRAARLQLAAFGTTAFVSVLLLIPAVQYAASEFYTSGFSDYASLFFDSLSRGYWQELLYSLSDSLPSFALLLLIAIGATFVWSAWQTNRTARIVFARVAVPA